MIHFLTKSKVGLVLAGAVATKLLESGTVKGFANKLLDQVDAFMESDTVQNIRTPKKKASSAKTKTTRK